VPATVAVETRPRAEVARARAWVVKLAPAKEAPGQKPATARDQALAWAPDLALLRAAAPARATDAVPAASPASPFRAAAATTAQESWHLRFRVALLRPFRLPMA